MQKAISKYWPVFVLPTLIAFIIGLRSLQNPPTEFTWSRYTAVSTETGWEPSESMNI